MTFPLAVLIGIVAGLRTFTAPAAVSWAARAGALPLHGSVLAFLGAAATPFIFTALAVVELVIDQMPGAPSRKAAPGFTARLVSGALCGAAIGIARGAWFGGLVGGYALRMRLAAVFGRDRTAAIIEDIVAIAGAALIVAAL